MAVAPPARGRASRRTRCSSCPATARSARALVARSARAGRDVHGLDRGRAADPARSSPERLNPDGQPVPLIAETGGQNALVVDSSALAEQVVADVARLRLRLRGPALLGAAHAVPAGGRRRPHAGHAAGRDGGARGRQPRPALRPMSARSSRRRRGDGIEAHVEAMRARGPRRCTPRRCRRPAAHGTFVAPTIDRDRRASRSASARCSAPCCTCCASAATTLDRAGRRTINATGYGLTFGLHTRIDETIERVAGRSAAGNVYVNRNIIGAVVGVQPFGGHGLSGTGPKAGGPLYLRRLLAAAPADPSLPAVAPPGGGHRLRRLAAGHGARPPWPSAARGRCRRAAPGSRSRCRGRWAR